MRKGHAIGVLALAGLLATGLPAAAQNLTLDWNQHRGYDVPFVPTPPEVVDEMLRLVGLKAGDVLYDLGCGDGRIVIAAAKRYGVKALGIDIDPVRIKESDENAAQAGLGGKVRFIQQDLFEADFRDATVVTMYLLTSVNLRLRPKLLAELKPGTRLVSHSFDMGEWKPDKTSLVETSYGDQRDVHFWIVPANVGGRWQWDLPDGSRTRRFAIQAVQEFQSVSASGTEGTWLVAVNDVVLAGDKLAFRLETEADGKMAAFLYEGTVRGDTIEGTVRPADKPKAAPVKWKAVRDPKTAVPIAK
jgi:SAM-dependent methyltransferase